jgi:hypothetical protein
LKFKRAAQYVKQKCGDAAEYAVKCILDETYRSQLNKTDYVLLYASIDLSLDTEIR